jgi:hypothetical protein
MALAAGATLFPQQIGMAATFKIAKERIRNFSL